MSFQVARNPRGVQVPYAELTQSATSINNTTFTIPNLTSTTYDNGAATTGTALADLVNDRIILRRAGMWLVSCFGSWVANATGSRLTEVKLDGGVAATSATGSGFGGTYPTNQTAATVVYVSGTTSYVDGNVWQASGAGLNCTVTLKAVWLGPY